MKKLIKVVVKSVEDERPDYSFIGEYTDALEPGVIVRQFDKFYQDLTAKERDEISARYGRESRGFKPYSGGLKNGQKFYKKYGMRDYERMEKLHYGNFHFIGIVTEAEIQISTTEEAFPVMNQTIYGGSLWGIESDSEEEYFREVGNDCLSDLKTQLLALGFTEEEYAAVTPEFKFD